MTAVRRDTPKLHTIHLLSKDTILQDVPDCVLISFAVSTVWSGFRLTSSRRLVRPASAVSHAVCRDTAKPHRTRVVSLGCCQVHCQVPGPALACCSGRVHVFAARASAKMARLRFGSSRTWRTRIGNRKARESSVEHSSKNPTLGKYVYPARGVGFHKQMSGMVASV